MARLKLSEKYETDSTSREMKHILEDVAEDLSSRDDPNPVLDHNEETELLVQGPSKTKIEIIAEGEQNVGYWIDVEIERTQKGAAKELENVLNITVSILENYVTLEKRID